jgi:hypothetical protein
MQRLAGVVLGLILSGCATTVPPQNIASVVNTARADQLAFATKYRKQGIVFRGTVQKKGLKASTATGFDFTAYGLGRSGGIVTGSGQTQRLNVNYGYVFLGDGASDDVRALCLFEPDNLAEASSLEVGSTATLSCLFSKFVGDEAHPTPTFSGCSKSE